MGDTMEDFIWQWSNGNSKIFTRKISVAEQALKEGKFVIGKKMASRRFKS